MTKRNHLSIARQLVAEPLEERRVLASSVGWDGPGQGSAELSYYIGPAPAYLEQDQVEEAIERALATWAEVADVQFNPTQQAGQRNALDFDFRPLDGRGGTLARAYFPDDINPARIAGDVHFDSGDTWEFGNANGKRAFDLTAVATHEIGHALGLEHSHASDSILQASISADEVFDGLSAADEVAILELYAARPEVKSGGKGDHWAAPQPDPHSPAAFDPPEESVEPTRRTYRWHVQLHRWGWSFRRIPLQSSQQPGSDSDQAHRSADRREFKVSFRIPRGLEQAPFTLSFRFYIVPGTPTRPA